MFVLSLIFYASSNQLVPIKDQLMPINVQFAVKR